MFSTFERETTDPAAGEKTLRILDGKVGRRYAPLRQFGVSPDEGPASCASSTRGYFSGVYPACADMRICLFTDTLGDVNGVCRFVLDCARRAQETNRDFHVLTSTRMAVPQEPNIVNLKPLAAIPMPGYPGLELALPPGKCMMQLIRQMKPDIIHISTPGPVGLLGLYAARKLRIPTVGIYHTDFPAYVSALFETDALTPPTRLAMRWFYSRLTTVLTRTEQCARIVAKLGINPDRIAGIRPGTNTRAFDKQHRDLRIWNQHSAIRPDAVKVLYVGRISIEKNMPFLASIWQRVKREVKHRGPDAQLIIIGDGPYRTTMEQELGDAVFLGFRHEQELSTLYASADLFVFPSTTDTLGQVVLEAQASGLPTLVSDQGGPQQLIKHNHTGFIIPTNKPDQWSQMITNLIANPTERQIMGSAAHKATQSHSFNTSFEEFWSAHERTWQQSAAATSTFPIPGATAL